MAPDATLVVLLCGIMSVCAMILTAVVCLTARDVRRTLRRVNALLPTCDQTLREIHRAVGEAHRVLVRSNRITRSIEEVAHLATQATLNVIEPIMSWKTRLESLFAGQGGNGHGARSGPRRHARG